MLKGNAGLTLLEILIALALVALAGTFVGINVMERFQEGKVNATKIQISNFSAALDDFARDNGRYPSTAEGLDALITNQGNLKNYRSGGYLQTSEIPKDPWGNDYTYSLEAGGKYKIVSLGADGQEGGEARNADITN